MKKNVLQPLKMMKIKSIQVKKKARYILSNEPSKKIKNIWLVCHGYGQSAIGFLNWFKPIFSDDTLIIAPEGLSKFYWEGFNGKVVSSWMTKENRKDEIDDYIHFIEDVVKKISTKLNDNIKFNVLGFSQGTATISRWANHTNITLNSIHLWSGHFPDDLLVKWKIKQLPMLHFHIGNKDPFINRNSIKIQKNKLKNKGIVFEIHTFNGKHKVEEIPLIDLNNSIKNSLKSKKCNEIN